MNHLKNKTLTDISEKIILEKIQWTEEPRKTDLVVKRPFYHEADAGEEYIREWIREGIYNKKKVRARWLLSDIKGHEMSYEFYDWTNVESIEYIKS